MQVNSYVELDLMRPNSTLIDLTNNFNGRVSDSSSYLKLWIKSNGVPKDLTNNSVSLYGKDPNNNAMQILGTAQADQPGDNIQLGRISFYFPAETFQVAGDWDDNSTFIAVFDEDGNRISTQNVHMHVLDDKVTMGINSGPYITDLEKIKREMAQWCIDNKAKIQALIDDTNSGTLASTLAAIKTQIEAYQSIIDNKAAVSVPDFTSFKVAIQKQIDDVVEKINNWTTKSVDIIINRDTQLTPNDYSNQYLGSKLTELVSAGTLGLGTSYGFGMTSYGFLETDVVPYTDNASIKGSVVQVYRCAAAGRSLHFTRSNTDATTWTAWSVDSYKSFWSADGIVFKNGASSDKDTPLRYCVNETNNLHQLMINGGLVVPDLKRGIAVDVFQLPDGAATTGVSVKTGRYIGGLGGDINVLTLSVSPTGLVSVTSVTQDYPSKMVYVDMIYTW